jgi:uncharacterized protein (TIGR01319 family)
MKPVLLIDFGSTYTKLTAVDLESETLLGTSSAYTTVRTDIKEGLENGMRALEEKTGKLEFEKCLACSSAAGGLRMIASGLVPELTSEAAKMACLGAGAKIAKIYSYQLTEDDIAEIRDAHPDIFLLVGGTDGGNSECILHNARALAGLPDEFLIIIAGNRSVSRECQRILSGHEVYVCENVMPKFGKLNIEPTQRCIRDIFLRRIVQAKGLTQITALLSDIVMPTPSAVLQALELFAQGCEGESGIGDLVAVDVGGATTDVYSIADGMPESAKTVYKGLPEPYSKRTVEGDIGMRYSVRGIAEAAGISRISRLAGITPERVDELINYLSDNTDIVPDGDDELERLDFALASMAIDIAVGRHAGRLEETYTMMGQTFVQSGKDLSHVKQIVVTGGSLIHTKQTAKIAAHALYDPVNPTSLRPKYADIWVDRRYILAAMGLLSIHYPQIALRIMKKELVRYGHSEQKNI